MNNNYSQNKFKELLDKLQQESWQLELLISGFAIFGLFTSLGPIENLWNRAVALESNTKFLYPIAFIACNLLIISLVVHVVLRGLWIGAIGLRYVSGEIDYDALKYKKRFTNHLKKKVGSFDKYIGVLENYCSILFAITFLSLFYLISFFIAVLIFVGATYLFVISGIFPEVLGTTILGFFGIVFIFLLFIVFLDFITQGYLKKKEWTSFLYFPIYKIFSVITMSFLYRPLVYNILDNKFSRRLTMVLTPVYILAFFLTTFTSIRSNYVVKQKYASTYYSNNNNYLNSLEEYQYIRVAALQSKIIKENYLQVFIPFKEKIEDLILEQNVDLKKTKDRRGFRTSFFLPKEKSSYKEKDSITSLYLKAFQNVYTLKIDGKKVTSDFSVTEINNQLGFETFISLNNVNEGKHTVNLNRFVTSEKSKKLENEHIIDIPFWYYKQ
ncbi:hypothetical protein JL193_14365 [Polaribacter batillariae]|uniref:ABC transporter permease n=1 Tax=Polaribacter batillariae TaxID=2808900 RepID=A0ABX7SVD5_9FLAO|nr:hypothetical protein [Polaribacter batillariae]QTD37275.1 hypothetical protein JL193_14365 [Polaribacter batillariae]